MTPLIWHDGSCIAISSSFRVVNQNSKHFSSNGTLKREISTLPSNSVFARDFCDGPAAIHPDCGPNKPAANSRPATVAHVPPLLRK